MILYGDEMPHSPFELAYEEIQSFSNSSTSEDNRMNSIIDEDSHLSRLELISMLDPFNTDFLTDEGIMEVMALKKIPWNDTHHHSAFLSSFEKIENNFSFMFSSEILSDPQCPKSTLSSNSKQNLGNISATIPIDISLKPEITENIHIGSSFSIEEIKTYKALFQES